MGCPACDKAKEASKFSEDKSIAAAENIFKRIVFSISRIIILILCFCIVICILPFMLLYIIIMMSLKKSPVVSLVKITEKINKHRK